MDLQQLIKNFPWRRFGTPYETNANIVKHQLVVKRHLLHGANLLLDLKLVTKKRNLTNLSFVVATRNNLKQSIRQLGSAA